MKTINAPNSQNKIKQVLFAFASSFIFLILIFVLTMLKHYGGEIDWPYLFFALPRIAVLSICPVVVVMFAKVTKWYWSVPCGIVVGFLAAVVFLNFK